MSVENSVEQQVQRTAYEADYTRPRLTVLYRILTRVCALCAHDARTVFRAFFPGLGTRAFMDTHARSLALPHVKHERDESLRQRLLIASHTMKYLGTRKALIEFMDSNFKNRWRIIEMPRDAFTVGSGIYATPIGKGIIMNGEGLYVFVKNITDAERRIIASHFEGNTPPDVGHVTFLEGKIHTYKAGFTPRERHQVAVFTDPADRKEKLWVIGGKHNNRSLNDVWCSADGVTWEEKLAHTDTPSQTHFSPMYMHQVLTFNNKLWIIGWHLGDDVWNSDDGVVWRKVAKTINPKGTRYATIAAVHKGHMWAAGGWTQSDLWHSDTGVTWTRAVTGNGIFATDKWVNNITSFKNKLWIIGGDENKKATNDVWNSDDGKQWNNVLHHNDNPPHTQFTPRSYNQVVVFADPADGKEKLWVVGGYQNGVHNWDVWNSDNGIQWNKVLDSRALPIRYYYNLVAFKSKLWMIGGWNGKAINDIHSSVDGKTWQDYTFIPSQ